MVSNRKRTLYILFNLCSLPYNFALFISVAFIASAFRMYF